MKKMSSVFVIFCTMLFGACKKEDMTVYTISGHFYYDCNMVPVSNAVLTLFEDAYTYSGKGGELETTYTDISGYFSFKFRYKQGISELIRYPSGAGYNVVIQNMPVRTSIENLILYKNPSTKIEVSLNVINPYTSNDTLTVNNLNDFNQQIKLVGPFTSGILYTASDFRMPTMSYDTIPREQNINYLSLGYKINSQIWIKTFNIYSCDSVKVVLDIN